MRRAVQPRVGQQISTVSSVPSPVGGWNARDPLAAMPPTDAVKLENWFPTVGSVVTRLGNADYGTMTGVCETLAEYNAQDGTTKFFACSDTDIYNVSSSGAGTAQSLTVTDGKFQYLNASDGTNQWLIMVNGADSPKYYDGSSWVQVTGATSPALSGVTLANLIHVCEYHSRLFFIEKDSLSVWYLDAGAVGGTLTEFDLSSYADKGGYLMWAATWTLDAGEGLDDHIVFMTSEGQAIVYSGTNPGSAVTWQRVGTYEIGKPLGRRSFCKFGGDLLALTQDGVFPLTAGLQSSQVDHTVAITDKIRNAFNEAAYAYSSNFGWEITTYDAQQMVIVNVPLSSTVFNQYVMNMITGAWCKFTGWNAQTFCVYDDELYFGGSAVVQKAWSGSSDDGAAIRCKAKQAFNNFGSTAQLKRFTLFRPMLQVNGQVSFSTNMDIDFSDNEVFNYAVYTAQSGGSWDVAKWDEGYWQASLDIVRDWSSPSSNVGYYAAGKVNIDTNTTRVYWVASDYVYERGGVVG